MKKIFILVIVLMFMLAACGSSDGKAVEKKGSDSASGAAFENNFFKATIPGGWEVWDDEADKKGMMRIRIKGDTGMKETIYLSFQGGGKGMAKYDCGTDPLKKMTEMAKDQKGSAPEKVVYSGIEFYKTSYNYGGKQTMMFGKRDGTCITITIAGGDISNPKIQEILKTIVFK